MKPLPISIKEKETHHWEKRRTISSENLEGGMPPPAPDQDLESSFFPRHV